jgi:hypothetical protein
MNQQTIEAVAKKLYLAEAPKDADEEHTALIWDTEPALRERFIRYADVAIKAYEEQIPPAPLS